MIPTLTTLLLSINALDISVARFGMTRELVSEMLSFNRSHRLHLQDCRDVWPDDVAIRDAIRETDALYEIWDSLYDGVCGYYYLHVRVESMEKLRTLIGDAAFNSGTMPPHVPLWRFGVIRD